jgi:NAD(P)-dependent dehydrogenase (short-subunit alcohol dehydrogenase family)
MTPYAASKAAFDVLAQATRYEVGQFGIETTIVMPGAFTRGTQRFPDASHASDQDVSRAYAALDPMIARYDEATESLYANEAARLLPAEPTFPSTSCLPRWVSDPSSATG